LEQSSSAHSIVEKYTAIGGFFPHGWSGITSAFLIVIFSFGGIELIGLTLSEVKDTQKALPKVLKGLIVRICFFYVLPILVICGLIPWNEVGAGQSPFVTVLSAVGLSQGAHIMNFIMLTAVISAANSGVYATSRMLYSLASDGEAPRLFTRLSGQGVPIYSLVASSFCLLIGACVAFIAPEHVFQILMSIPGFAVLVMWITICLAQLKLRKANQTIAKSSPFWTVLTMIALGSILVSTMINTKNIANTLLCVSVMIVLLICSYFVEKKKERLPIEGQKIAS
jgi:AAT family amino acid transporter